MKKGEKIGSVGKGFGMFYLIIVLNLDGCIYMVVFKINDFIVLLFEDWIDQDYNDVMFNIWFNLIEVIVLDVFLVDLIDLDDVLVVYCMIYKGILVFEDNWFFKGDYDLNDVIVKYSFILEFNIKNQVFFVEDMFMVMWFGVFFKNGFVYQLNIDRSNVECSILEGKLGWDK